MSSAVCACDEVGLLPMQEAPCDGTRQNERCDHARGEIASAARVCLRCGKRYTGPACPRHNTTGQAPSAASTDLAALSERDFWPLIKQAKERVLTNDLDALEALIVEGLPADEMQAAAWALVQRVRGLKDDLARLERARAGWQREAQRGS